MLACVYNKDGKFEITEKDVPKPKRGGAVIKVKATSICGTDFRAYKHGSTKIETGTTMGHEVAGDIIAIDGVENFKVGDRVTVTPALGCGECYMCKKGHTNMCSGLKTLGFQYDGSFAEYMEIPPEYFERDQVNHIPDNVSYQQATLAEPVACALNAQEYLNIEDGDYVAIFGSGFIGTMHAELALASGADKVIMIEPNKDRLEIAKKYVPQIYTITGDEDVEQRVMEITDGRGADVAIVACSVGPAQENAQKIIGKCGRISLFGGLPGDGKGFVDSNVIHYKEVGVFGSHASTGAQNRKVLDWLKDGKIETSKYISNTYPLSEILEALNDIDTKGIMKAVIVAED